MVRYGPRLMSTLRTQIHSLASKLAEDLLDAVRSLPLEELVRPLSWDDAIAAAYRRGPTLRELVAPSTADVAGIAHKTQRTSRHARRSQRSIDAESAKLVQLVSQHPNGLLAEELRKKSGLSRRALFTPLTHALASGGLKKKGEKRKTTYFAGPPPKKSARERGCR